LPIRPRFYFSIGEWEKGGEERGERNGRIRVHLRECGKGEGKGKKVRHNFLFSPRRGDGEGGRRNVLISIYFRSRRGGRGKFAHSQRERKKREGRIDVTTLLSLECLQGKGEGKREREKDQCGGRQHHYVGLVDSKGKKERRRVGVRNTEDQGKRGRRGERHFQLQEEKSKKGRGSAVSLFPYTSRSEGRRRKEDGASDARTFRARGKKKGRLQS